MSKIKNLSLIRVKELKKVVCANAHKLKQKQSGCEAIIVSLYTTKTAFKVT